MITIFESISRKWVFGFKSRSNFEVTPRSIRGQKWVKSILTQDFWVMNMFVFKPSFKQLIDCINWSARIGLNCLGRVSLSHKPTRCDKTQWDIVSSVSEQRNGLHPCPWCISWPGNNSGEGLFQILFQEKLLISKSLVYWDSVSTEPWSLTWTLCRIFKTRKYFLGKSNIHLPCILQSLIPYFMNHDLFNTLNMQNLDNTRK